MEFKIATTDISKPSILTKVILIIFGTFVTSLIFAISLRLFEETGIWIGIISNILLAGLAIYYRPRGSRLHWIAASMILTVFGITTAYIVLLNVISKSLEGF